MQIIDQPQHFPKQVSRYRKLGHLESGVPAVTDNPGCDLHQLLPRRGQSPETTPASMGKTVALRAAGRRPSGNA